jgi:hypothetical protein
MSLVGLLITFGVVIVLLWAAKTLIGVSGLGQPASTVIYVVLVLLVVLWLLGAVGGLGPGPRLVW